MKTLILTCNTGQGHNSSASSIRDVFTSNGQFCEIMDALGFLSKRASKIVDKCFTGIYRHIPKAFDSVYTHTDAHIGHFSAADSMVTVLKPGCKRLYKYIIENGYDNIICVHLFPAIMVTVIKEKYGLSAKSSLLTTDYTCYPFTEKTDMDLYFLPHADLANEYIKIGKTKEKLVATGIPVRNDFLNAPDKVAARSSLGLPRDSKVIFIMGGSMGCGPMEELVLQIARAVDADTKLLVSCGTNEKLLRNLKKHAADNTTVFSYSNDIPAIMSAADLFVTKPGGISITEAAVSGLPAVIIDVVGGCETPNFKFFTEHEYYFGAETTKDVANECIELLKSPEKLAERSHLLRKVFYKNSAEEIYKATAL